MDSIKMFLLLGLIVSLVACKSGPKVIESDDAQTEQGGGEYSAPTKGTSTQVSASTDEHKVVVEEVLDTDKYTYLFVEENGEKFWIAAPKMEIEKGEELHYSGGLLKKNFFSREYNRVFETLYLVSDVHRQSSSGSAVDEALRMMQSVDESNIQVDPKAGSIKLSELFKEKEKYDGKVVQVTGKIVKVNPNIMGRNWLHLKDGTIDDLDLTVTTGENIPIGHTVTLEGTIALNKDFGAGYRYDIIMEGAVLK